MADPPKPPVEVAEIPGRGRGIIATRDIKAGEVLLRDSPILSYTAASAPCYYCFRIPATAAITCSSCWISFCSIGCASLAASSSSSHTPWSCRALAHLRTFTIADTDILFQANFLIAALNLAAVSSPSFLRLMSLQGLPSENPSPETLNLHSFISSVPPPKGLECGVSLEMTSALLAKDKQNAFGLMEPFREDKERSVRGYGIYPTASFFNHDCLPNACRFDYLDGLDGKNTDIIIRAIHDIPQGREVCLSYFPVNWVYADRQRRLSEDYGFVCKCDRCEVEKNWKDDDDDAGEEEGMEEEDGDDSDERMDGSDDGDFPHAYFFVRYLCDRENCGGTLAPLPASPDGMPSDVMECNVCGRLRKEEDLDGDGAEDN
ncbi:Histone-lysine N-methyltransferase ASHR2 [Acorus gramineus]|uniref:Histone-lysine N-methyltransferase ASHR2 n=1 Tax=Acorus gramineus TaxID=55184 RepID=A0AAV9B213_ACOGR|nr:Histone-lysine N-methyltransferase ASHR2 [Acorus gramineus]